MIWLTLLALLDAFLLVAALGTGAYLGVLAWVWLRETVNDQVPASLVERREA